jgi:iron complex outermembrane recepter protein
MNHPTLFARRIGLLSGIAVAALAAGLAHADDARLNETRSFAIPAQSASTAVPLFVRQSGLQILASTRDTDGVQTNPVQGNLLVKDALYRMVDGTPLTVRTTNDGSAVLVRTSAQVEAAPAPAAAAVESAASADTVVVTGTRKSLRDALGVKRAETGIVEAISSKDIGALPDVTIAESLARLPGITTARDRGNDSQATIRGLGARMVLGTVNGREVASSEPDRSVRWEIYPSEVVSGVEVYKSSEAKLISGGISGTVDIQTTRPLDYRGPAFTGRIGPVYYDGGKAFPGYDGLGYRGSMSWVKKITPDLAIVVGLTAQEQKNGFESVQGWGYNDDSLRSGDNTGPIVTGGAKVPTPWGAQAEAKFLKETRYGASTGLQWKPSDNFELKYDLLYSNIKIDEGQNQNWYGANNWGNWAGGNAGSFANPKLSNGDLVGATTAYSSIDEIIAKYKEDKSLIVTGLNGKWTYDKWVITADASYSYAERTNSWAASKFTWWPTSMTWNLSGKPAISITDPVPTSGMSVANGTLDLGKLQDSLTSGQFDVKRSLDAGVFTGLQFGARYAVRTKGSGELSTSPAAKVTGVPAGLLSTWTFDNFNVPALLTGDFYAVGNALYGAGALNATGEAPINSKVKETVTEAYAEAFYASELSGVPVNGNIGVRVVDVNTKSAGISMDTGAWYEATPGNWVQAIAYTSATGGTSYTKVLPSASARFDFGDGKFLKLAAAQVLSRPPMSDMRASRSISTIAPYSGSSGNPFLKPFEATQLDVSYEYYFGKDSLAAISGYYKDVSNYIGYSQRSQTINGNNYTLTSPVNATKNGSIEGVELTFQTPFSLIPALDHFGIYSNYAYATSNIHENVANLNMVGLANHTLTMDLWYSNEGFDARLGTKYHSPYTAIFGWDDSTLIRVKQETTMDLSTSYAITPALTVRFQANNLLDTPLKTYRDNKPDRLHRYDIYGRRFLIDLTFKY